MNKHSTVVASTLAVVGLFFSSGSMAASVFDDGASDVSIELCVAQVAEQANYDDASRVRHEVGTTTRRSVGHLLHIDTKVYGVDGDQLLREYSVTCVVGYNGVPRTLKVREVASGV